MQDSCEWHDISTWSVKHGLLQVLQQSAISVISTPNSQRQEHQVVNSQSGNIDKTVIRHQHEFVTTQLGSKTLRKGVA